jgi:enoyl-[acyl-carrier protein] reductase/trans-2-enoyl-CoA reductase (NAD+)
MIKPKVRGGICMNAHPAGCAREVRNQISTARSQLGSGAEASAVSSAGGTAPKTVLVIGGSTGYGLSSRIAAAFGYGAETISVSFEREPTEKKPATPGWYNTAAFDREAEKAGIPALSFYGDAFSHAMKQQVAEALRERGSKVDLLVYSLASGMRPDPDSDEVFRSALKPIGAPYTTVSLDFMKETLSETTLEPANDEEIRQTVKVMGGEDWQLWTEALQKEGLLADDFTTVAYSYIGPEVTHPIYRSGTIGKAKEHLEGTARELHDRLGSGGSAYVSINKAVVTRASAVIPAVPLYISLLFSVMKEQGLHEGCQEQMNRLLGERIYTDGAVPTDDEGRIRLDDWEMREDVQREVGRRWDTVNEENLHDYADIAGYRSDFLRLHGFDVPGVDYEQEVDFLSVPEE